MKTFNTTPVVAISMQPATFFLKTSLVILLLSFITASAYSQSQTGIDNRNKLKFKNPVLESGVAGADNAIYRFNKVEGSLDALIRITRRSSPLVKLLAIDLSNTGHDEAFQPQVTFGSKNNVSSAAEWWMEFEITFVDKDLLKPAKVAEFNVSGIDIDGNGHLIREFISFYGLKTYSFEENTLLSSADIFEEIGGVNTIVGKRFDGPTVNYLNIDTTGTSVMVTNHYKDTNKFRIKVGGVSSAASYAADRMYSVFFKSFTYQSPVELTLPVKLQSFTGTVNQHLVVLNWQSSEEVNMSHYELERSVDGKIFKQAALIFTGDDNTSSIANYSYTDKSHGLKSGNIYYRLRMVDRDAKFTYSAVRVVNLNVKNEALSIALYPNPAQDQVQVTIPKNWENSKVIFEVYGNSGQVMARVIAPVASQTESINISSLQSGMYTLKAFTGNEVAVKQIVKNN